LLYAQFHSIILVSFRVKYHNPALASLSTDTTPSNTR
jgi:hypothetical protein